jgi:hypothetical protein
MARPSKKTATNLRRMAELHAAGVSNHEIAAELGLVHTTVARWLAKAPALRSGDSTTSTALAHDTPEPATPDEGSPGDLGTLRRRLAAVTASVNKVAPLAEAGEFPAQQYAGLVRLERDLVAAIAELTPPPPPDPDKDPTNREAAANVRRRFERLVASQEAIVRCVHCGQHPFEAPRS